MMAPPPKADSPRCRAALLLLYCTTAQARPSSDGRRFRSTAT